MATCHCMGPQNGEPLCPCLMRASQTESVFSPLWKIAHPTPEYEDDFNLALSAKWDETMRRYFG